MNKNYIILNGKRYNAITGELLPADASSQSVKTIDHVAKAKINTPTKPAVEPMHINVASSNLKPKKDRSHHSAPVKIATRKPKKSTTLMRHAVKKPSAKNVAPIKIATPVTHTKNSVAIKPKKSVHNIDASKVHRASLTPKSNKINKFGTSSALQTHLKPILAKQAPIKSSTAVKPAKITPYSTSNAPVQSKQKRASAQFKKQHLLEQALKNAVSHEQAEYNLKKPSTVRRKLLSSFAVLGAVLVVGSFVMYLNRSSVELQVASVKAGFQASAPAVPSGFQRQTASAEDGKVAISFVSPSNDSFTLTQESSTWDSQTLFDSIVAVNNNNYQAIQSQGRTIYIYDGDKAAWVNGGILYNVSGNAKLDSDQIISLATSM